MAKVIIAFHPDSNQVGKTADLDNEEAAALVREGRARYADTAGGGRTASTAKAPSKQDSTTSP